jgi:hypothetical protein
MPAIKIDLVFNPPIQITVVGGEYGDAIIVTGDVRVTSGGDRRVTSQGDVRTN